MAIVVAVRFRPVGKAYHFDTAGLELKPGDKVVVETARGPECGTVVMGPREVPEEALVQPLKPVLRLVTPADLARLEENQLLARQALAVCREKVAARKLNMEVLEAEYTLDRSRLVFYFSAESRVDFRDLVRELAACFRTRIELRQIGVRDEAKILGGLGPCGRVVCCASWLCEFQPVSIRMAKDQSLSLNPTKISGLCGRLMCCLRYEAECYRGEGKAGEKDEGKDYSKDQDEDQGDGQDEDPGEGLG
ncbi:MAG TPA: stage 0 sporulation family protein [Firmicutes bacterium]|nr:stage 0 sporulation family protein [Bacillota bacterium]